MLRMLTVVFGLGCFAGVLVAEEYNAKVKSVDVEAKKMVVNLFGAEVTFDVVPDPRVFDPAGKPVKNGLKIITPGSEINVQTDKKDDKEIVSTIRIKELAKMVKEPPPPAPGKGPKNYVGKLKSVDAAKLKLVLNVEGKDLPLDIVKTAKVFDYQGKDVKDGVKLLKPGLELDVTTAKTDKDVTTIKVQPNKK